MPTSTLTSKGQITIPKVVREKLGLRVGQRVEFELNAGGEVTLRPRTRDVRSLRASVRSPLRRPVSLKEMDAAIAGGVSEL